MFESGVGHIRPTLLEPGRGTGQVRFWDLAAERLGKIGHVRVGDWSCLGKLSGTRVRSRISRETRRYGGARTCPDWGLDMSGKLLWNLDKGPDKSGQGLSRWGRSEAQTCPVWEPDMSKKPLWNPVCKSDMSDIFVNFGWKIVFDVLHFTNSPNASLLIVRSL
jgi:hypothetical protein